MKLCSDTCSPCCDFCVFRIPGVIDVDGKMITSGPEGCSLFNDDKHNAIAIDCGYCEDFVCFNATDD